MVTKKEFAHMYNTYADKLYRFVYAHTSDSDLAEDITSESFTRAWNKRDSFDGTCPQAWLFTIARNLVNDHWRSKHSTNVELTYDIEDASPEVEDITQKLLDKEKLQRALHTLPKELNTLVTLRFMNGMSAKEVGKILGKDESNIRVMQFRALKKLRELL